MLVDLDQDTPRTYSAKGNPTLELILTFGGGFLFLLALAFMIVVMFISDTSTTSLQPGIIGGLSVMPIMLISRGIYTMRNISRVTLDRNGITLESMLSFKPLEWKQLAKIEKKDRSTFMGQKHQYLILLGPDGKELAAIADTLDGFADLVQQIEYRLSTKAGDAAK